MPKLYFRYGTMNSSKTANLVMTAYNYRQQGKKIILVKPEIDSRDGANIIKARPFEGLATDIIFKPEDVSFEITPETHCILVDESQFLSTINIDFLRQISTRIPVICYGLRTDYTGKLFEGSKRLFELADSIEEIKTECVSCSNKAIINARVIGTKTIFKDIWDGEDWQNVPIVQRTVKKSSENTIELGGCEMYEPMCWNCWNNCIEI